MTNCSALHRERPRRAKGELDLDRQRLPDRPGHKRLPVGAARWATPAGRTVYRWGLVVFSLASINSARALARRAGRRADAAGAGGRPSWPSSPPWCDRSIRARARPRASASTRPSWRPRWRPVPASVPPQARDHELADPSALPGPRP